MVLDVDRLKLINDRHGHLTGAAAVQTVGHLIATGTTADAAACRYGGDEFVIALPQVDAAQAVGTAEHLRRTVHSVAPVLAGVEFPAGTLSISVGLASQTFAAGDTPNATTPDDEVGEALFQAADAALYAAKNGGRNRVHGM
jgi:diguanylate cyclase (GGDEF)-like protein